MIHYLHIWWHYPERTKWARLVLDHRSGHTSQLIAVYKIKGTLWSGGRKVW